MKIQFVLAVLIPTSVFAAGPIDGTWKTDMTTYSSKAKPVVYKLKDGMFSCSSCSPPYTVKADGSDQPIKGRAYADMFAITVIDSSNVTIAGKQAGKPAFETKIAVSADGKTVTQNFRQMNVGTEAIAGTMTGVRKGTAKPGEGVTGSWEFNNPPDGLSDAALTVMYATSADGISMKYNGQAYDAKWDGKQVPISNDPTNTMASVKKVSDHEFIETDYRVGKKVEVTEIKVAADGKTAMVVDKNIRTGEVSKYTINKQS